MSTPGTGATTVQYDDDKTRTVLGTVSNPYGNATVRPPKQIQVAQIASTPPSISSVAKISDERSMGIAAFDPNYTRSVALKYQRLLSGTQKTEKDLERLNYAVWMSDRAGVSVEHAFWHAEDVQKRLFDFADNVSVYDGWKYFRETVKKANWEEGLQDRLNARFEGIFSSNLTDEEKEAEYEKIRQEYVGAMNDFPSFKHAESWVPTSWIDGIASTIPYMTKIGTAAAAGALVMGGAAAIIGSGFTATPIVAAAIPSVAALSGFGAAAGGFIMSKQLIQNQHTISRLLWEDENGNHLDPRVIYWTGQLSSAVGAAAETYLAGAVLNSIGKLVLRNAAESVISASLWKRAGQGALLYLKGVGTESFEEGFQKVTEDVTDNLAKWIDSRMNGNKWDYVGFKDGLRNAASDFMQSVPTMMALGFLPFAGATAASMATAGIDKRSDARVYFDTSTGDAVNAARIINPVSDYDKETVDKRIETARTSRQKLAPIKVVDAGTDINGQQLYRVVEGGDVYQGLYEQGVRVMQIEELKREDYIPDLSADNLGVFERTVNDLASAVDADVDISQDRAYIISSDADKAAILNRASIVSYEDNTSIPGESGIYGTDLSVDIAGEVGRILVVTEGTWATDKLLGTQVQQAIDEIGDDGTNTKPLQSVMRALYRETRGMDAQQATDHMNKNAPRILRQLDKLTVEEAALPSVQQLRKTLESGIDASVLKATKGVASEQAAQKAPYEMTPDEYAEQAGEMDEQDQLSDERKKKIRSERARKQWEQQKEEDATERQKEHAEKLQQQVDKIDEQVGTKTIVVPRAADLPANVAEVAIQYGLAPSDVRAVYHNGSVYINADRSSASSIEATWAHEWIAHRGLHALFGDAFVSEMEKIFDRIGEKVINAALPAYLHGKDKATRAEEYLAQKAEQLQEGGTITSQEMGFLEKVTNLIRRFLRKIGINVAMSDAEIRRLLSIATTALGLSVTDTDGKTFESGELDLMGEDLGGMKESENDDVLFKVDPRYEPEKVGRGYKLFELVENKLYPLFIGAKKAVPLNKWLMAENIPTKGFARRPGWHIGASTPDAPWLRGANGAYRSKRSGGRRVWAEVEYPMDREYQGEADKSPSKDLPDIIPTDGYYLFKEGNRGTWVISGAMKVTRVLSDSDVQGVLEAQGYDQEAAFEPYRRAFEKRAETLRKKLGEVRFSVLPETYDPRKPLEIDGIIFDNDRGAGAVGNQYDANYFGFTITMPASEFLDLASPMNEWQMESVRDTVEGPIAAPFFEVEWNKEKGQWEIYGHEGRHRVASLIKQKGRDFEIPVNLLTYQKRDRDLTPDMATARILSEKRNRIYRPNGTIYLKGERIQDGSRSDADEDVRFQTTLEIDTDLVYEMPGNKVLDTQERISAHNAIVEAKQILLDAGMLDENVLYDLAEAEMYLLAVQEVTNLAAEYLEKAGEKRTLEEIYQDHQHDKDPDTFSPDMDLFEWAIQAKGVTDDINEAGYVLPDGTMLDFSGKRDGGPSGERTEDHRQLYIPVTGGLGGTDLMVAFQKMGAMRVDANSGLIDLEVMPSSKQLQFIKDMMELNEDTYFDLQDGDRYASFYASSSTARVIGQIRKFYSGQDIATDTLFQPAPPTDSEAFKAWFGDSKVVDENGDPLVVYHGTANDFLEFDRKRIGENYLESNDGFFFIDDKNTARRYASLHAAQYGRTDGRVVPVYLSIQDPYVLQSPVLVDSIEYFDDHSSEILSEARENGKDGVVIKGEQRNLFVAFSPTQIKSVNNQGTWDAGNPNILFQVASPIDSKEFKQWFGSSVVVDRDGDPVVVYHGSPESEISEFDRYGSNGGETGLIYATEDAAMAENFAYEQLPGSSMFTFRPGARGRIYPLYMKLEHPLDLRNLTDQDYANIKSAIEAYSMDKEVDLASLETVMSRDYTSHQYVKVVAGSLLTHLGEFGYDGMIAEMRKGGPLEYAVASSSQAKSVENLGSWDASNPDIRFQVSRDPYRPYLRWTPETTADGKMKGAPGWLQNDADFGGLLRLFRKLVKEGVSGRYWYEESAREVWRIADGDPVKAEKFIMLLAIYSPRNSVPINTVMAIRAFSHWMAGLPEDELHSGMTMLDDKAKEVLYHDTPWEGRKTESFYINLMHELVKMYPDAFPDLSLSDVGTMDMWMARVFGYDVEAYPNDKGSGKYSFSENTLKRIAAELNAKLKPGGEMWTTHQVQAAIWSAIKTRYELKSVIDSANEESIKKGYSWVDGKGNVINPKTGDNSERGIAHREIYRRHALTKAGTSDEVKKLVDELGFSFRETLVDSTHVVTWEAIPSPKLGYEILNASRSVQQEFTRAAMSLIIDADGSDRLAKLLGVPMHFAKQSQGGYENAVSPNVISSLVPPRMIKEEANFNKVRLYAGAIQYIFKQNAVPFFKFRSKPIVSEADKGELKYRVVTYKRDANNKIVKTTTVPRSTMNTQAEAEAFLEKHAAKHPELVKDGDYPTIAVHGGKFSKAVVLTFDKPLTYDTMVSVLSGLSDMLDGVGFTKINPDKMVITNFRDGTTGAPWTYDEDFIDTIGMFIKYNGSNFGITDSESTWTEGEYGYDQSEEWGKDREGSRILDKRGITGQQDLQEWVVRRGDYFGYLIKRFSGKNLKRLEKLYNQKVEVPRELYTDRFQVVNTYHGTTASFDRFDPDYIGSGERSQVFGWGFYLTNNREIAESYRQRQIAQKYPQAGGPQPYGSVYKVSLDESLRFVDYHLPFERSDYDRIVNALVAIDDDFLNDMIDDLDPGMAAGSVYRTISGGIAADYDDLRGTSEFLDELGINGFRYQSGTINGIPEEGSYNYVVFDPDNAVIEKSDIRFATVPEKYRQRHRQQVQAAMKRGITVPDRVLQAYADEKWASDELNDRKLLRSFSWLIGIAKNVHSPEELRELANEELGKQGFDVLSVNTPEDLAFYERIIALAASETKGAYVSMFMDIVNSDRQLRAMISEIADAREDYHGLGLPRFMWDLVAKVDAGSQVTDADLDMIRSYAVRNREKLAQAYYAGRGDLVALAQFGSEEVLYGDEAPAERALNASLVKDPEVRQQMLDGTISYARLVDYETQLQQEVAQLEGENDSLQRTIDGLNKEILEQKEQQKETVSKLREFYRDRTDRIVQELREKQQERDEVRKEREYVEKLAARMRRPVPSQTTSYAVGRKMNAVAELVIPKRWYRMEGTPLGRKRVPADKERAAALLEYLANPDQGVNEFLDAINEFRELTLGDFTTDQIRLLYSLTERIREQGRREMEAFLDAQRERRNEAIGKILKEVLRGEKQKVFENIGSIETSEEQASGPVFHAQAMSLRPPRMILLMSGGKEGVMYDWYINKINTATDNEIREYQRRLKAGQQMMKENGISVHMLEKEMTYGGVTMRADDVLHLWIAMMNEKSAAAVIYGNRISREVISGLTSQLSPGMKKWGYYMLKDFEDNYKRLNDTFIADRNMDMGKEAYYFPMIRQDLDQMPLGDEFASQIAVRNAWRKGYAEKKFTIDRLDIADEHQKPIRLGATQIWFEQVNKQEHYISSALLAKDLQYIADNQVLRDALKQKYGRRANTWLRKYVNDWANPTMYKSFDAVSRWMGVVRNNMAVAYLGWNLLTVLKQAPSLAFYFRAASPLNMLKAASEMILNPMETIRFVERMDPQVAARSYDRLTEELKAYDPSKVVRGMKAIGRVSMKPIMWMDKVAVSIGWMAVYHNAKGKGMSDLEAAREAQKVTLDSQPAGRAKDVAEMYRSNELANWFTMFSNQLNQIWNMYAFDIPNAVKQREIAKLIGILTGIGVSGLAIAYLSGWRMPDEPEDLPEEAARQLFLNFLSVVPFLGNGLKSGYDKQFGVGIDPFPIAYTAGKLLTDIKGDPEKVGPDITALVEDLAILTGLPATGVKRVMNVGRYGNLNELLGYGFTQYTREE